MKRFKLGSLREWEPVGLNEIIMFVASSKGRSIAFQVNASAPVVLWAAENEDMENAVLVAAADGQFSVEMSTRATLYLQVDSAEAAEVFFNMPNLEMQQRACAPSLTKIEPRRARDPQMDRMMALMRQNELARTARLEAEIERLQLAAK